MTILNEAEMWCPPDGVILVMTGLLFSMVAVILFCIIASAFANAQGIGVIVFVLLPIFIMAEILLGIAFSDYVYVTYEVTLNSTYPAAELLEKYDVVERRGDIYVLKEVDER